MAPGGARGWGAALTSLREELRVDLLEVLLINDAARALLPGEITASPHQHGAGSGFPSPKALQFPSPLPQKTSWMLLSPPRSPKPFASPGHRPGHRAPPRATHVLEASVQDLQLFAGELGLLLELLQPLGAVADSGELKLILDAVCKEAGGREGG